MAIPRTDKDRVNRQVRQLLDLQLPDNTSALLEGVSRRRRERVMENLAGTDARKPLERVAVALLGRRLAGGGDVAVVKGELIAPRRGPAEDGTLGDALHRLGFTPIQDPGGPVLRFASSDASPDRLQAALDEFKDLGVSPNHVAALSGRMKGLSTPEHTDTPLKPLKGHRTEPGHRALVVVVDTGIDAGAQTRTDGWLDGVVPLGDIDPLDVVDHTGGLGPDGLLDWGAGHGTFVAGIVRQVEPTAEIRVLRALDTDGLGSEATIIAAIEQAAAIFAQHGNRGVLNLSLGWEDDEVPPALETALAALPPDVLVVAAAGNAGTTTRVWPAASDRVLAVAGLDHDLAPAKWSSRGDWVDFSTIGEGIVSTFVVGTETTGTGALGDEGDTTPETFPRPGQAESYALWTGTSFAAPQVAAWLAGYLAQHPEQPAEKATEKLTSKGSVVEDFGHAVKILDPTG